MIQLTKRLHHGAQHDARVTQMAKGHLEAYPFIMDTVNVAAFLGQLLLASYCKRLHLTHMPQTYAMVTLCHNS